ncbi:uncharacterized protein ACLA_059440 [Aspergillus clavatus NRRL 1]|uniref:Ketopantoate reductase C-terminal domain-containing protein n=1 Tax=Aspergillus clavatus (strain ATCC 1007 / CBS 513.65 / DSM 816 / NCTC 3887 / NRRL 1 / QM 1276 / 107) TaxID=344612 RepID=A1C4D8_ASPCL|nr:uncharacterized protein ACLA_059440 [Aspergillus clavatus NRRL 1]EAW15278.1 conserved hypothetical protein [Aspergillus clavatus NRRL 1]
MAPKSRVLLIGAGGVGTIAALNLERGGCGGQGIRDSIPVNTAIFAIGGPTAGNLSTILFQQIQYDGPNSHPIPVLNAVPHVAPDEKRQFFRLHRVQPPRTSPTSAPQSNAILAGVSIIDAHEIAPADIQREAAERFVRLYGAGGKTDVRYESDWKRGRWRKLVFNATVQSHMCSDEREHGPSTSLRQGSGFLGYPRDLPGDVIETTIRMYPSESQICPSMQEDMERGNLLEHENLFGEVVREAQRRSVPTPILSVLYELCSAVQWRVQNESKHRR